jgi:trehalose 6-phosphate phosphatase
MIGIFSEQGLRAIEQAAAKRALLCFDFDGTLAPIVSDRRHACMRESTRVALGTAALVYPTAIISGRGRADVALRVAHVPLVGIVGNHGAESGAESPDRSLRRRVEAWAATLRGALADVPGVEVEDKGVTLAVHYRRSRRLDEARRRILVTASALPRARVSGGLAVVNICPAEVPTKGDAIERLARQVAAPAVVYVGDDVTDEDAFECPAVTLAVRVGRSEESSARWFIDAQEDVDELLEALVAARATYARAEPHSDATTVAKPGVEP